VDAMGQTWDCTPLTNSNYTVLNECMGKCQQVCPKHDGPDVTTPSPDDYPNCRGKSIGACQSSCRYRDKALEKICKKDCANRCPPEQPKCATGLDSCLSTCDEASKRRPPEKDCKVSKWEVNCLSSRCCLKKSYTCFKKDDYFASCRKTCPKGWDCTDLAAEVDADTYRKCVDKCGADCAEASKL